MTINANHGQGEDFHEEELLAVVQLYQSFFCPLFREAPLNFTRGLFGHCQKAIAPPPPRTQTGTFSRQTPNMQAPQTILATVYTMYKKTSVLVEYGLGSHSLPNRLFFYTLYKCFYTIMLWIF